MGNTTSYGHDWRDVNSLSSSTTLGYNFNDFSKISFEETIAKNLHNSRTTREEKLTLSKNTENKLFMPTEGTNISMSLMGEAGKNLYQFKNYILINSFARHFSLTDKHILTPKLQFINYFSNSLKYNESKIGVEYNYRIYQNSNPNDFIKSAYLTLAGNLGKTYYSEISPKWDPVLYKSFKTGIDLDTSYGTLSLSYVNSNGLE